MKTKKQTQTKKHRPLFVFNKTNLQAITQQINKNQIIAVTKKQPIEAVKEALENQIINIGENKIQEIEKKYYDFKDRKKITLHMIGHLQTNKIKKAVQLVDVIQTVENKKTINKIQKEAHKIQKQQQIFLQINIGKDPQKKGIKKEQILEYCQTIKEKKNIILKGVMVILPQNITEKKTYTLYSETKQIQTAIQKHIKTCKATSMGMSKDYKIAIKAETTYIRIGTALFGKRK